MPAFPFLSLLGFQGWSDEVSGGPMVPAVSWKVNKEEEADENETEWEEEKEALHGAEPRSERHGEIADCRYACILRQSG